MRMTSASLLFVAFVAFVAFLACAARPDRMDASPPPITERIRDGGVRQPKDTVGYTHSAEGIDRVVSHALEAEGDRIEEIRAGRGWNGETAFRAAISPHDDYAYAQQVYVHIYPYLKARHVVLIGVAHHGREYPEHEGKLVFDAFHAWHGPYTSVPISPLRDELISSLPEEDVAIASDVHAGEHSLEGLIPFLQHYNRQVAIVPVLVPYMSCDRLLELAEKTAAALQRIMKARGLELGSDVALLISGDCVHYGDTGWGGKTYAEFGTDEKAYEFAINRDLSLIGDELTGKITLDGLRRFYGKVVAEDFHEYRITWCGRFSVPFGLSTLIHLAELSGQPAPEGILLRYGTTLDPGRSDPGVDGMDVTAPANLNHWVGFTAVGYR